MLLSSMLGISISVAITIFLVVKFSKNKKFESEKYQFRKKRVLNKKIDFK